MSEKFSTVTVGGVEFRQSVRFQIQSSPCDQMIEIYRRDPDLTIVHERCDDATCEICNRVFGAKR